jgi:lysophospholipase L1-like esterase
VLAAARGADVVEAALPGRTTAHDDPEMLGPAMNGLAHLPVALKSHCPLDRVLVMLGTNDLKRRFAPTAAAIAANAGRLVDCIRATGGGPGGWDDPAPPRIGVIVPAPLGPGADDPAWPRHAEWAGGRVVSLELAAAFAAMGRARGVAVFDAGDVVAPAPEDPVHLDAAAHGRLGSAVARWLESW